MLCIVFQICLRNKQGVGEKRERVGGQCESGWEYMGRL